MWRSFVTVEVGDIQDSPRLSVRVREILERYRPLVLRRRPDSDVEIRQGGSDHANFTRRRIAAGNGGVGKRGARREKVRNVSFVGRPDVVHDAHRATLLVRLTRKIHEA